MLHISKTILLFSLTMTTLPLTAMEAEIRIYSLIKNSKATADSAQRVRELLKGGANPDYKHEGVSLLNWAVHYGRADICKVLLAFKANPNVSDRSTFSGDISGSTPLLTAIKHKSLELVTLLLNQRSIHRDASTLRVAIEFSSTAIFELLLNRIKYFPLRFDAQNAALALAAHNTEWREFSASKFEVALKFIINSRKAARTYMLCLTRAFNEKGYAAKECIRQGDKLFKTHILKAIVPYNKSVLLRHLEEKDSKGKTAHDIQRHFSLRPEFIDATFDKYLHKDLGGRAQ